MNTYDHEDMRAATESDASDAPDADTTPESDAYTLYGVIPDVNDDAKCDYLSIDHAGMFALFRSCDQAIECARIVSRCVASHVFVIYDDGPHNEYAAIYRRGARVTIEQYRDYEARVLCAPDTSDARVSFVVASVGSTSDGALIEDDMTVYVSTYDESAHESEESATRDAIARAGIALVWRENAIDRTILRAYCNGVALSDTSAIPAPDTSATKETYTLFLYDASRGEENEYVQCGTYGTRAIASNDALWLSHVAPSIYAIVVREDDELPCVAYHNGIDVLRDWWHITNAR